MSRMSKCVLGLCAGLAGLGLLAGSVEVKLLNIQELSVSRLEAGDITVRGSLRLPNNTTKEIKNGGEHVS